MCSETYEFYKSRGSGPIYQTGPERVDLRVHILAVFKSRRFGPIYQTRPKRLDLQNRGNKCDVMCAVFRLLGGPRGADLGSW